jgi:hypothetical protein
MIKALKYKVLDYTSPRIPLRVILRKDGGWFWNGKALFL